MSSNSTLSPVPNPMDDLAVAPDSATRLVPSPTIKFPFVLATSAISNKFCVLFITSTTFVPSE